MDNRFQVALLVVQQQAIGQEIPEVLVTHSVVRLSQPSNVEHVLNVPAQQILEVDHAHFALIEMLAMLWHLHPEEQAATALSLGEHVPRQRVQQRTAHHGWPCFGQLVPQERVQRRAAGHGLPVCSELIPQERMQQRTGQQVVGVLLPLLLLVLYLLHWTPRRCILIVFTRALYRTEKVRKVPRSRLRNWSRTRAHPRREPMTGPPGLMGMMFGTRHRGRSGRSWAPDTLNGTRHGGR